MPRPWERRAACANSRWELTRPRSRGRRGVDTGPLGIVWTGRTHLPGLTGSTSPGLTTWRYNVAAAYRQVVSPGEVEPVSPGRWVLPVHTMPSGPVSTPLLPRERGRVSSQREFAHAARLSQGLGIVYGTVM